ncbi:MAG: VCBS repeat-containing protein, partial [Herpetosiphonaceae bacterium]|nr:VCBS repeat-containing protein [Herpetosiphonaceae bacterium]
MSAVLRRRALILGPLALIGLLMWTFSSVQPGPTVAEMATPLPTTPLAVLTPTFDLPMAAATLTITVDLPTAVRRTPQAVPPLIDDLGKRFCLDSTTHHCQNPLVVKLLDYLYRNPEAPDRTALLDRFHTLWFEDRRRLAQVNLAEVSAIVDVWVEETLVRPLQAAGLTAELQANWEAQGGTIAATDLDSDGATDYVVTSRWMIQYAERTGEIYWLHNQAAGWQLERIPARLGWLPEHTPPWVVAIDDFDADGQSDLAFRQVWMGNTDFHLLTIVTRDGAGWRSLYNDDADPTGGWEIIRDAGGTLLISHHHGGGTAGTSALVRYDVNYRLRDGEFLPTGIAVHTDLAALEDDQQLAYVVWSEKLLYAGQFEVAAAQLDELLRLPEPLDPDALDYRPIGRFRLGMARLLGGDVAAAQAAWAELERYPDSVIAQDMQTLRPLVAAPDDVWAFCTALAQRNPDWEFAHISRYHGAGDWPSQCNSQLIVPFRHWPQGLPIAEQMQALGVAWTDLSTTVDLNGDGVPDPLGWLEWANRRAPWAFLSADDRYTPLLVTQPYPLGALDYPAYPGSLPYTTTTLLLTDLDANGIPEVLLDYGYSFDLRVWTGDRFRSNWIQT